MHRTERLHRVPHAPHIFRHQRHVQPAARVVVAGEVVCRGTAGLRTAQRHAEGETAVHAEPALQAQFPGRFLGCLGAEAEVGGALGEVGGEPRGEACGGAEGEPGGDTGGEILLVAELLLRVGRRQLEEGGSQQELRPRRRLRVRQHRRRQRLQREEGAHHGGLGVLAEHLVGGVAEEVDGGVDEVVAAVAALGGGGCKEELLRVRKTAARREESAGDVREERLLASDGA